MIKPTKSASGDLRYEGVISQYDILKLIKDGDSADTYKYDLNQYHICIEKLASLLLNGVSSINNRQISVRPQSSSNLLKVRIRSQIQQNKTT